MKKVIFGIFAHPDDEAFGPSGTLLMERENGATIHLVSLTYGDAGANPDNVPDLAAVRRAEWQAAGALIGATTMTGYGYSDGRLNNLTMIEIQEKLIQLIQNHLEDEPDTTEVELLTIDRNGVTGHIDHIVAARSTSYAFYALKATDPRIKRLRLSCIPRSHSPEPTAHWLYMDAGRDTHEINETVDATDYRNEIIAIMRAHHSQRGDGEAHIAASYDHIGMNYFIVKT